MSSFLKISVTPFRWQGNFIFKREREREYFVTVNIIRYANTRPMSSNCTYDALFTKTSNPQVCFP